MSDNYRALTRTYRPTSFDDIVSQQHVSSTLKNAIKKNRLAHAYMFCGPRGVGKTTMARVLARTVNQIDQQVDGESLNQTLNVVEIDAASNNSVDDIRDLRERVRIPPQNGRYKIYIIDEVHMLSKSAFNALLKTLEEPPDHVIFIFATTEPHKVLPTILSRVQRFDFKRISVDEIVERLTNVAHNESINVDEESLHVIAKKADGALRDALGLMDQAIAFCGNDIQHEELLRALNVVSTERMFDFMKAVEQQDASQGLELINNLLQDGYDIQEYLVGLTEHLRNLYVAKSSAKMHLVEASPETKKRYQSSCEVFSEDGLMRMLHIVSEAQYKIKEAHQPKIQFEITLLKLIHMERTENLNKLLSQLKDLKKKGINKPQLTDSDAQPHSNSVKESNTEARQSAEVTNGEQQDPDSSANNNGFTNEPSEINDTSGKESAKNKENGPKSEESSTARSEDNNDTKNGSTSVEEVESNSAHQEPKKENEQPGPTRIESSAQEQSGIESDEDEFDNLFGESSLGQPETSSEEQPSAEVATAAPQTKKAPKRPPKDITLDEIENNWETYLDELKQHVPQMLYFQMQRVDPVELKNGALTLRCNDNFAKKIVVENNRRLGKLLEDEIGAFLNFKCIVQKDESADPEESMSPYERFKKLQEKDPIIKKLVDTFGAELDYNLSQ